VLEGLVLVCFCFCTATWLMLMVFMVLEGVGDVLDVGSLICVTSAAPFSAGKHVPNKFSSLIMIVILYGCLFLCLVFSVLFVVNLVLVINLVSVINLVLVIIIVLLFILVFLLVFCLFFVL